MIRYFSGWPVSLWYLRATFSDSSTASAPELLKNTVSAKLLATSRWASFSCPGMRNRFDECHNVVACLVTASITCGWQCPSEVTAMPLVKSRNLRPSVV